MKLKCFLKVFQVYSSLANDVFASIAMFKYLLWTWFLQVSLEVKKRMVSNKKNMAGIDFRINQSLQTYKLEGH